MVIQVLWTVVQSCSNDGGNGGNDLCLNITFEPVATLEERDQACFHASDPDNGVICVASGAGCREVNVTDGTESLGVGCTGATLNNVNDYFGLDLGGTDVWGAHVADYFCSSLIDNSNRDCGIGKDFEAKGFIGEDFAQCGYQVCDKIKYHGKDRLALAQKCWPASEFSHSSESITIGDTLCVGNVSKGGCNARTVHNDSIMNETEHDNPEQPWCEENNFSDIAAHFLIDFDPQDILFGEITVPFCHNKVKGWDGDQSRTCTRDNKYHFGGGAGGGHFLYEENKYYFCCTTDQRACNCEGNTCP